MATTKYLPLGILPRAALVIALGLAAAQTASAEMKVGFVNVAKVLELAPQAEAARHRIERIEARADQLIRNGVRGRDGGVFPGPECGCRR